MDFHYLYLSEDTEFTDLPESLRKLFGQAEQFMQLDLAKTEGLANVDIERVRQEITEKGYFLQLPPDASVEELLTRHFS